MYAATYNGFISLMEATDVKSFTVFTDEDLGMILAAKAAAVLGTSAAI
jgi:hypothetical protein